MGGLDGISLSNSAFDLLLASKTLQFGLVKSYTLNLLCRALNPKF